MTLEELAKQSQELAEKFDINYTEMVKLLRQHGKEARVTDYMNELESCED